MPRATRKRKNVQFEETRMSTAQLEQKRQQVEVIMKDLKLSTDNGVKKAGDLLEDMMDRIEQTEKDKMKAIPKHELNMNVEEWMEMKTREATEKMMSDEVSEESDETTSPVPDEEDLGDLPPEPSPGSEETKKTRNKRAVPPHITPTSHSLITPKASPARREVVGEMLYSVRGSPVVIRGKTLTSLMSNAEATAIFKRDQKRRPRNK